MHDKPKHIRFTDEMKRLAREKLELQWRPDKSQVVVGLLASTW